MMVIEKAENFEEELGLLLKLLKPAIFRFAIVQQNHIQVIDEVKERISKQYPNRKISRIKVENKDYRQLMDAITSQNNGCLIIEDFHEILSKPDVYIGFNQRRDKIAQFPITLICFIPTGNEVLQDFLKKIPDFWSFRNLVISLEVSGTVTQQQSQKVNNVQSTIGGGNVQEKEKELNRLKKRIDELKPNSENISLLNSLYPELFKLLEDLAAYKEGLEYADRYLEIIKKSNDSDLNLANAFNFKALFTEKLGDYSMSALYYDKALKIAESNGEPYWISTFKNNLANVLAEQGEFSRAAKLLESALKLDIEFFGENHPSISITRSNLALIYQDLGNFQMAEDHLKKALSISQNHYGFNHPVVVASQVNLASIYLSLNEFEKAIKLLEFAVKFNIEYYGPNHPTVARGKSNLAMAYKGVGRIDQALVLMDEALKSDLKNFGENHPVISKRMANLASIYLEINSIDKAIELLESVLKFSEKFLGENHPEYAVYQLNLGQAFLFSKNLNKSQILLKKAYKTLKKTLGAKHPDTMNAKTCLDKVNKALS